jgi:hypothetical protein
MKVKFPLYIIRRHIRKAKVRLHSFLTSSLDAGKWSVSLTGRFISREELLISTKSEAGRGGDPRVGLYISEKRKYLLYLPGIELRSLCRPTQGFESGTLRSKSRLMFEAACWVNDFCDAVLNTGVTVASLRMDGCDSKTDSLYLVPLSSPRLDSQLNVRTMDGSIC